MSLFDNIPEFDDDHDLTAEDLNSFRNAIIQVFTQGLESSNIKWPLVALGILDMNNNAIINIGSVSNVFHVNSTNSLLNAYDALPSTGGSIIVDPGFEATTSAAGLEIAKDNVRIYGNGFTSSLSCDGTAHGLLITGNNCEVAGLKLVGTAPQAIISTGADNDVVSNLCAGTGGIQVGSSAQIATQNTVKSNRFRNSGPASLTLVSYVGLDMAHNDILNEDANGSGVLFDGAGSYHRDARFVDNEVRCTGANGVCFDNPVAGSNIHKGLILEGNIMEGDTAIDMPDFQNYTVGPNVLRGDVLLGGEAFSINGCQEIVNLYLFGTDTYKARDNFVEGGMWLGHNSVNAVVGMNNSVINNDVLGNMTVHITTDPGVVVYVGNTVAGTEVNVDRLLDEGIATQYLGQ